MNIESKGQSEMGYLLQTLTAHLLTVIPKNCHSLLESWMDGAELQLTPKHQGLGVDLGMMEYEAVISIERFPFREFEPAIVMASVMAWLQSNDPYREPYELEDPRFKVEPESDKTANVEIDIQFIEPVTLVEEAKGVIHWHGKQYNLAEYEVWVAERFTLDLKR